MKLGAAVGPRRVGLGPDVPDPEILARGGERLGCAARAVVGRHPADGDPEALVIGHRGPQALDGAYRTRPSQATCEAVVDADVGVLPAGSLDLAPDLSPINRSMRKEGFPAILTRGRTSHGTQATLRRTDRLDPQRTRGRRLGGRARQGRGASQGRRLRQRPRIDQQGDALLERTVRRGAELHPARQAHPERFHGEPRWQVPGQLPEPALVQGPRRRQAHR